MDFLHSTCITFLYITLQTSKDGGGEGAKHRLHPRVPLRNERRRLRLCAPSPDQTVANATAKTRLALRAPVSSEASSSPQALQEAGCSSRLNRRTNSHTLAVVACGHLDMSCSILSRSLVATIKDAACCRSARTVATSSRPNCCSCCRCLTLVKSRAKCVSDNKEK